MPPAETPPRPPDPEAPSPRTSEGRLGAAFTGLAVVALVGGAAYWVVRAPVDRKGLTDETTPSTEPTASSETPPPPPPRCARFGTQPGYRLGTFEAREDEVDEVDDDPAERAAAFGVEVSRAVPLGDGFLVGVRSDGARGASAAVARISADATTGKTIELGRSRGDFDAPLVAAHGGGWLAGILEPNASGATLRLGVSRGDEPPRLEVELDQGRDESLAFDFTRGKEALVVVWDDVTKDGKLARVLGSTLDVEAKKTAGPPVVLSRKGYDAETPRIVARDGGFWVAYIARKALDVPKRDDDEVLDRNPKGDRYAAEKIDPSWLEILTLDASGRPSATPWPVTPERGHVLSFDIATTSDGSALVTWRDDDTPSGSQGGRVSVMTVSASGGTQAQVVAEHDVGAGVPSLLSGWLAIPNAAGKAMLAPLDADGTVAGDLRLEPAIGVGDPLVANGERILVATSAGTALDLGVVTCKR
ncbi:MAG: hypothetical protein FJ095_07355 [Deltaproteobacteria bacterium]|nr:hypothetical protein [Deltaproteobacteria bacterium]